MSSGGHQVEVEDRAWIAPGEEKREERDDAQHDEGDPEEEQDDEVRDPQQPLDELEPAAQMRIALALDPHGIDGSGRHVLSFLLDQRAAARFASTGCAALRSTPTPPPRCACGGQRRAGAACGRRLAQERVVGLALGVGWV